jgi:para-aminobenzoate synthetase component 1
VLAAGVVDYAKADAGDALQQLQHFITCGPRWIFGHLGYDLKNEIENLYSLNPDYIGFPDLLFFQPAIIITFDERQMTIESCNQDEERVYNEIMETGKAWSPSLPQITIQSRFEKDEYLSIVEKLRAHILRGDCYEVNFCQEFFAENVTVDPLSIYRRLSTLSPNPFSALYKLDDKYLLCASPERFLKKKDNTLISQPIKGTARRIGDELLDGERKKQLLQNPKERAENVMVVDLVRNDLSKICVQGTVRVDELYGIYSFPQVHHMISTVSGELRPSVSFLDMIRATFPMGSMTGAPKKKVLELIEQFEKTKRGIFSGALGYITPQGDFDFNVVIRSIMYNRVKKYLSYQAGSAITFYSNAQEEWEECLVKAEAMGKVLGALQ